jgi:hypothetical protein
MNRDPRDILVDMAVPLIGAIVYQFLCWSWMRSIRGSRAPTAFMKAFLHGYGFFGALGNGLHFRGWLPSWVASTRWRDASSTLVRIFGRDCILAPSSQSCTFAPRTGEGCRSFPSASARSAPSWSFDFIDRVGVGSRGISTGTSRFTKPSRKKYSVSLGRIDRYSYGRPAASYHHSNSSAYFSRVAGNRWCHAPRPCRIQCGSSCWRCVVRPCALRQYKPTIKSELTCSDRYFRGELIGSITPTSATARNSSVGSCRLTRVGACLMATRRAGTNMRTPPEIR